MTRISSTPHSLSDLPSCVTDFLEFIKKKLLDCAKQFFVVVGLRETVYPQTKNLYKLFTSNQS